MIDQMEWNKKKEWKKKQHHHHQPHQVDKCVNIQIKRSF